MPQLQSKIERALRVDSDSMYERWLTDHSLIALAVDSHELGDFAIIRCAQTGKPLGMHGAAYLAELQRTLGVPAARFSLMLAATKQQQAFTRLHRVGETLTRLLLNEPVTFFMHALAEYGGWYQQGSCASLEEETGKVWATIQQRAHLYDAVRAGLDSRDEGALHMRTLLHACELLRRYLAIAFKHKQRDALTHIIHTLTLTQCVSDAEMQEVIACIKQTITTLILDVRDRRKEIKNSTNLVAEIRNLYGAGGGVWRAQGKADKYYSSDEASRVLLEALDIELVPQLSPLEELETSNRIKRAKAARKVSRSEPVYEGRAHKLTTLSSLKIQ